MKFEPHGYEFVGTEPMRKTVADSYKSRRIAKLSGSPVYLEPVLNLLFAGLYKGYWTLFMGLVWIGYAVGDNLRELSGRS